MNKRWIWIIIVIAGLLLVSNLPERKQTGITAQRYNQYKEPIDEVLFATVSGDQEVAYVTFNLTIENTGESDQKIQLSDIEPKPVREAFISFFEQKYDLDRNEFKEWQSDLINISHFKGNQTTIKAQVTGETPFEEPRNYSTSTQFCEPLTCNDSGYECDSWDDGCGGTMNCGGCSEGSCNSSGQCEIGKCHAGDVDCDGKVDIFDLASVGLAYGTEPGDNNWNPNADFDNNDIINIFDLATVGLNYGWGTFSVISAVFSTISSDEGIYALEIELNQDLGIKNINKKEAGYIARGNNLIGAYLGSSKTGETDWYIVEFNKNLSEGISVDNILALDKNLNEINISLSNRIDFGGGPQMCIQVIQPAILDHNLVIIRNVASNKLKISTRMVDGEICQNFPNPCVVPDGWEEVNKC